MEVKFFVYGNNPQPSSDQWRVELAKYGLLCEFTPGFDPKGESGFVDVKLKVNFTTTQIAQQYLTDPLWVGFHYGQMDYLWTDQFEPHTLNILPEPIRSYILNTKRVVMFSTNEWQDVANLRVLHYAAATFALLTDGIFQGLKSVTEEPIWLFGNEALQFVEEEISYYESLKAHKEKGLWNFTKFGSWEPIIAKRSWRLGNWEPDKNYPGLQSIPF